MTASTGRQPLMSPDLVAMMQIVMRVGVIMLQSGTVSFRVEQAMQRVALGLGAERLDAYVTLTGVTATIHCGDEHYTQIARTTRLDVDMHRLSAVEHLTHHLPPQATPEVLSTLLNKIEQMPSPYPTNLILLAVAVACGAFAVLSGGNGLDGLAACLSAGCGLRLRWGLQARYLNPIAVTVICAAVATSICYALVQGFAQFQVVSPSPQASFLAAVLFQVPGMLLVTASLDLVRLDLLSGLARVTYALIQLFSVALGIVIVITLTGLTLL
jgi:uncharacterized membrane protein YjjP (DUF1212 family)